MCNVCGCSSGVSGSERGVLTPPLAGTEAEGLCECEGVKMEVEMVLEPAEDGDEEDEDEGFEDEAMVLDEDEMDARRGWEGVAPGMGLRRLKYRKSADWGFGWGGCGVGVGVGRRDKCVVRKDVRVRKRRGGMRVVAMPY